MPTDDRDPRPARDDDPTHALDDFVQRMRQAGSAARPAGPTPGLSDLGDLAGRLHQPPGSTPDARETGGRQHGGVLRSGQRWRASDVEDVPAIDLPRPAPPDTGIPEVTLPPVDLRAEQSLAALQPDVDLPSVAAPPPPDATLLDGTLRGARDFAASQWDADAHAATQPVWQPDAAALQLRSVRNPRLLAQWQAGAWVGALRQVLDSATEFIHTATGPAVQTYAAQHLLLLWPPVSRGQATPAPDRWPQQAMLLAAPAADAPAAALALLPADAALWLVGDSAGIDWALGADIVLHHDLALRPFQADGLRAFIETERAASFARLNAGYRQLAPGGPVQRQPA